MRRLFFTAWLMTGAMLADALAEAPTPADTYSNCAACHLPDGAGIPGAFPPLKDRVAKIAALDGGREYLVTVISFGLMGQLDIGGLQYFGVMPGNKNTMSEQEIAAALNYVIYELSDTVDTDGIEKITADEVAVIQAKTTDTSLAGAAQIREALAKSAGDKWAD